LIPAAECLFLIFGIPVSWPSFQ